MGAAVGVRCLGVSVRVRVVMAKVGVAHGHEFDKEEDEDCHEGYALGPVVLRDWARKTFASETIGGGSEEVDESCGDDDA